MVHMGSLSTRNFAANRSIRFTFTVPETILGANSYIQFLLTMYIAYLPSLLGSIGHKLKQGEPYMHAFFFLDKAAHGHYRSTTGNQTSYFSQAMIIFNHQARV